MAFGLHKYLPASNDYFTILRNPVERVISYYNFILRTPEHYLYEFVKSRDLSLHDLIESQVPLMMNDAQVRLLSGVWGDVGFGKITSELLKTAETNLQQYFIVVGLTEEFDKTLLLLRNKLNWGQDIRYQRKNVNQNNKANQQSQKTLDIIAQFNQMDIALYDFAQSLFIKEIKAQGALFPWKVKIFQIRNK